MLVDPIFPQYLLRALSARGNSHMAAGAVPAVTPALAPVTVRGLLRRPGYRRLWLARTASQVRDVAQFTTLELLLLGAHGQRTRGFGTEALTPLACWYEVLLQR